MIQQSSSTCGQETERDFEREREKKIEGERERKRDIARVHNIPIKGTSPIT
jgi:hypothetical protein